LEVFLCYNINMKLSQYAKKLGLTYKGAWNLYKKGKIKGFQLPTGTIIIPEEEEKKKEEKVVIYCRVSSSENKSNLDSQAERLISYCYAKGYKVSRIVKEVGSGVNDRRQKFLSILSDPTITRIVAEHRDRLTRFGFNFLKVLTDRLEVEVEIVNEAQNDKEELMQDLISIITSFCARYYGLRSRRKTEKIIEALKLADVTGFCSLIS